MFDAFLLSLRQLTDRRVLALMLKILGVTLLLVIGVGAICFILLGFLFQQFPAVHGAMVVLQLAFSIFVAFLMFRIVAMLVINIYSDEVVDAVEARHYPARAATARPPSQAIGLKMGLKSATRALGYNLLAMPVYIMLVVTGIGTPVAFLVVNGLLIGRDLQDMIASRHVSDLSDLDEQWKLPKLMRFGLGVAVAFLLVVPFVNFLAPIVGAAMATHLVHRRQEKGLQ